MTDNGGAYLTGANLTNSNLTRDDAIRRGAIFTDEQFNFGVLIKKI